MYIPQSPDFNYAAQVEAENVARDLRVYEIDRAMDDLMDLFPSDAALKNFLAHHLLRRRRGLKIIRKGNR